MKIRIASTIALVALAALPLVAQADIVSLQSASVGISGPLSCFDFTNTLKLGSKGYAVRGLQFALISEGFTIPVSEYGIFGQGTLAATSAFQAKYAGDILKGGGIPSGLVGKMTRAKLNALYGCNATAQSSAIPQAVVLNVKNVSLDSTGVTGVFCNNGPIDIPVFPVRIRLNGIIRDFSVTGAVKAGMCDTERIPYATWGLTYDPGSTYGVVTAVDPNSMYKSAQVTYPLTGETTLSVPAVQGAHLSIRGISVKSNGLQGTLCNLGTTDLPAYPVRVTVNGTSKDVDAASVHAHGVCQVVTWTWDMFGLSATPAPGTLINATVNIDPNNVIQETNEFDNSATILGRI